MIFLLNAIVQHCTTIAQFPSQMPTHFIQSIHEEVTVLKTERFRNKVELIGLCEERKCENFKKSAIVCFLKCRPELFRIMHCQFLWCAACHDQ